MILREDLKRDIDFTVKQRGAMMAKGRLLGIQFLALFEDGLYYEVGRRENAMAMRLRAGIERAGYELYTDSRTNQLFALLPDDVVKRLEENFEFEIKRRSEREEDRALRHRLGDDGGRRRRAGGGAAITKL